jgi:hypothetical protein
VIRQLLKPLMYLGSFVIACIVVVASPTALFAQPAKISVSVEHSMTILLAEPCVRGSGKSFHVHAVADLCLNWLYVALVGSTWFSQKCGITQQNSEFPKAFRR